MHLRVCHPATRETCAVHRTMILFMYIMWLYMRTCSVFCDKPCRGQEYSIGLGLIPWL